MRQSIDPSEQSLEKALRREYNTVGAKMSAERIRNIRAETGCSMQEAARLSQVMDMEVEFKIIKLDRDFTKVKRLEQFIEKHVLKPKQDEVATLRRNYKGK